jgi:2'-5' RNA ligase
MGRIMPAPQYYLYVALPARLSSRVAAIGRRYGSDTRSDPHITIVIPRTLARGRRERELVRAVAEAARTLSPCLVTYRGVDYFGARDFIYVPVRRTHGLRACHDACMRAVDGLLEASPRTVTFDRPHITLAGRLPPERADRVWQMLARKRFEGQFLCRELVLLRKRTGETRWQPVSRIPLGGRR